MELKKAMPTGEGWYWVFSPEYDDSPRIEYIRNYAGDLAIGNYRIVDSCRGNLWSEKIEEPANWSLLVDGAK